MKYVNSTTSISSLVSTHAITSNQNNSSFEELVSKLFSCNIVLVLTDHAKQFVKNCFGPVTFASILNQFASITDLHMTIRDLNGHNAYALNRIRFRFFDLDQFKNRPNGAQLKKLHLDIVSSMSNTCLMKNDENENNGGLDVETPWYDMWKNVFIDTFEPSDHDFIGTNCGCFFVISKAELPHYKVIFERLCASVKQNPSLRFIQSDFVRYFIVLSDQILEPPLTPNADEFTKTCQSLKLDFPNSFVFYMDVNNILSNNQPNNAFSSSSSESHHLNEQQSKPNKDPSEITNVVDDYENANNLLKSNAAIVDLTTDPLTNMNTSTTTIESSANRENSKIYEELQSQRQQNQQNNSASTLQSRDIINDWLSHLSINDHHSKTILDSVSDTIDFMLKEFISKFLIPWAEKQIKILGEMIAQRKGFRKSILGVTKSLLSNMSSSTASLTKSLAGTTGSGVIYIPDAQEMQQRKLADICMIFNIYEMAHSLYYSARKDFQSESAWIYYAGASEMSAISSYFLHKYQQNHMEKAITTYLDLCRSINLATRATILATELLCQLNKFKDAANLYIRLVGDDSDLRSALFLEQAAKCYLSVSPKLSEMNTTVSQALLLAMERSSSNETVSTFGARYRKAAFHFILAGHRFNRCGLKQFALCCYRRYNYPHWESASDHVNSTVAKLFLSIASTNSRKQMVYYQKGLEIFQKYSYKQHFFNELLRELKKCSTTTATNATTSSVGFAADNMTVSPSECCLSAKARSNLSVLEIPYIENVEIISPDSIQIGETSIVAGKKTIRCFIGEDVHLLFTLVAPFDLTITHIRLMADQFESLTAATNMDRLTLKANEKCQLPLRFCSISETEFTFIGLEFQVDGLCFRRFFQTKITNQLSFVSIKTSPLILFNVHIAELDVHSSKCLISPQTPSLINIPKKVYASEMFTLNVVFNTAVPQQEFNLIQLATNAKDHYEWSFDHTEGVTNEMSSGAQYMITDLNQILSLIMQIPPDCVEHRVHFRLVYSSMDGHCRTVFRELRFEVVPCFRIELLIDPVITIQNLSQNESLAIYNVTIGDDGDGNDSVEENVASKTNYVLIPSHQSAHVLMQNQVIPWIIYGNNIVVGQTNLNDHNSNNDHRHGKINMVSS